MTTKRREATRDRLVEAARELLAEIGIQGATVEAICERAGFTRGAFYSNYASKDELIVDLFAREKTQVLAFMQAAVEAEVSGDEGVPAAVRIAERFLEAYPHDRTSFLVHLEFITHGIRQRAVAEIHRQLWAEARADMQRVLEGGAALLGGRLVVTPEQAVTVLIGAYELAMRDALLDSEENEADLSRLRELIPALLTAFIARG
ncbi:MAG: TetR/AcrR family transcriptional regulator [Aeromicrobium sp.]|uniref:TetR/AcrR family transcriptional regulator n=1 Tax=Aeromicrobium sp. TaxID=1871063 RepID=UPI0039E3ECC6